MNLILSETWSYVGRDLVELAFEVDDRGGDCKESRVEMRSLLGGE